MLNNTLKHASAQNFEIEVHQSDDHLVVEVSDDGKGLDYQEARIKGAIGLKSIAFRLN